MSFHATNPASFSNLSSCAVESGDQEPFDAQLRWRIAPFLRRNLPLESHCNCGELPQPVCR